MSRQDPLLVPSGTGLSMPPVLPPSPRPQIVHPSFTKGTNRNKLISSQFPDAHSFDNNTSDNNINSISSINNISDTSIIDPNISGDGSPVIRSDLSNPDNNAFFNSPHFELLQQNLRELERSVSPFEIPHLGKLVFSNPGINKTDHELNNPIQINDDSNSDYIQEQIDLRIASSNNPTAVLELDMDGNVRHLSNTWEEIVGTSIKKIVNKPISSIIIGTDSEDSMVFHKAIEQMVKDDGTYKVKFITPTNYRRNHCTVSYNSDGKLTPNNSLTDLTENDNLNIQPSSKDTERNLQEIKVKSDQNESSIDINRSYKDIDVDTDIDDVDDGTSSSLSTNGEVIELEAQGILIHDPTTNLPLHSMWTIKPFHVVNLDLHLPNELIDLLGMGSEFFEGYLINLKELGIINEESVPQPKSILCRICEQHIPVWFIEKHNELCLVEHKWNDELQESHDGISEQKQLLQKILESYWHQQQIQQQQIQKSRTSPKDSNNSSHLSSPTSSLSPNSSTSSLPSTNQIITDYKGIPLPSLSSLEFSQPVIASLMNTKKFPFGILQRLIELCDESLQINLLEDTNNKDSLSLSPNTNKAIEFVNNWKPFDTNDLAIRALIEDTQNITKNKVDTLGRLISFLKYFKKISNEVDDLVLKTVHNTIYQIKEKTFVDENEIINDDLAIDPPISDDIISNTKDSNLDPYVLKSFVKNGSGSLLHSPIPSKPTVFEDTTILRRSTSPLTTNQLLTPKDFLLKGKTSFEMKKDIQRTSSSSSLSRESMKHLIDSLNEVDIRPSARDLGSSSAPRRHLSPAPYVERQSLSSLQRTNLDISGSGSNSGSASRSKLTPTSPLIMAVDSRHDSVVSSGNSSGKLIPQTSSDKGSVSGQGYGTTPSVSIPFNGFSGPSSAKSSISRPPLSPLLVSQTPTTKPIGGSIKDYEVLKAISKGAFGSVFLARRKLTGEYVAIKVLKKTDMIAKNQILNVKSERAVMMRQTDSPYVAQLYNTFQTKDYLYLVMEYLPGGDVAALLKVLGTLGNAWAKQYIAEVILSIDDLHKRGIIHRDLKPDNLLIDLKGHLKLTDFGLSRMGIIGRQKRNHRKSSSSDQNIDFFRKSIGPGLSPLVTVSQHASVNGPSSTPIELHKRTSSVTPFSLSPTLDQIKGGSFMGVSSSSPSTSSTSAITNHEIPPQFSRTSSSSISQNKHTSRTNSTISGSGLESPLLHVSIPRTNSETSIPFLDDEYLTSPSQSAILPPASYALYDPKSETDGSVKKFVGTPDYLAPETIRGIGQSEVSDWWAVGCILFEFLFGYQPFHANTPNEVFANILDCKIDWPELTEEEELEICPPKAKALIKRLLVLDPDQRLGINGAEEIMNDPYFDDINWDTLFTDEPTFVPVPENPESTDYFDPRGADLSHFPTDEFSDDENLDSPAKSKKLHIHTTEFGSPSLHDSPTSSFLTPGSGKRERRGSRLADTTEFGSFNFRNLSVLEKANKDVINRLKNEHLEHRNSFSSSTSDSPISGSRGQSLVGNSSFSPFKSSASSSVLRSQSPNKQELSSTTENSGTSTASGTDMSTSNSNSNSNINECSTTTGTVHPNFANHTAASSSSNSIVTHNSNNNTSNNHNISPGLSLPIAGNPLLNMGPHLNHERMGSSASTYSSGDEYPFEYGKNLASGAPSLDKILKVDLGHSILHKSSFSSLSKQVLKFSDFSPSSSDTEENKTSALLRIKRRRQSGRRPGSFSMSDGRPMFTDIDVLYCELIPIVRLSITKLLERLGCIVVAVSDGDEFIRRATSKVKFDVIFTALRIPKVDAPDAVKLIRHTSGLNSKTPIIAITGYAKEATQTNCFSEVLEKPIDSNALKNCLAKVCSWTSQVDDDAIESDSEK